tara:strand:- start:993 stop:1172 length:180 start_codon:yes stop_codon:yes gene_type:complete
MNRIIQCRGRGECYGIVIDFEKVVNIEKHVEVVSKKRWVKDDKYDCDCELQYCLMNNCE